MPDYHITRNNILPGLRIERRSKSLPLNIIGVSFGYHDSACSLLQDGDLVAAAQEERFSRTKNDKAFPGRAFQYCMEEAGLTISDLDCIAYYEDPCMKLGRQIWMGLMPEVSLERRRSISDRLGQSQPQQVIRDLIGFDGPIEIVDHHLSHAASS